MERPPSRQPSLQFFTKTDVKLLQRNPFMAVTTRQVFRICSYLLALFYVAASKWAISSNNPKVKLLIVSYCLLLPAAFLYLRSFANHKDSQQRRPGRSLFAASAAYLIIAVPLAWLGHPGMWVSDEASYVFQARTFLDGRLTADPPISITDAGGYLRQYALGGMVIVDHHWVSKFTPGWPVLLAPGMLFRIDWAWNVLIGLAFLWLTSRIALLVYGPEAAYWAPWLLVCPYVIFNCLGYMAHPSCALAITAAVFYCIRSRQTHLPRTYCAMIACIAVAFFIRPFTAVCAGGAMILFAAWDVRRDFRLFIKLSAIAAGLMGLAAAGLIAYNWAVSGEFRITLYSLYGRLDTGAVNFSPSHIIAGISYFTPRRLFLTIVHAFPFIFLLSAYALWSERGRRWETNLLVCVFASLVIGHLAAPVVSNNLFGERFYLEGYPALAVVGAQGLDALGRRWSARKLGSLMWLLMVAQVPMFWLAGDVDLLSRRPSQALVRAVERRPEPGGVVFIRTMGRKKDDGLGPWRPAPEISWLNLNGPTWRSQRWLIFGDPGPERRAVFACSVGRPYWVTMQYDIGALLVSEGEKADSATVCPH